MSQWQIMSFTFIVKYANVSKSLSLIAFFISFILTGTTSLALNYNSDTKKGIKVNFILIINNNRRDALILTERNVVGCQFQIFIKLNFLSN